ncbi:MAG: hypothetical protein K2W96_18335, partial [Gemmataceae bacterium]|nr:hypothetical protein [Gemmataceae bacterium]
KIARSQDRKIARAASALVGCLLMVAAALKAWGLNVSPFAQHGWLSSAPVQLAAVAWEAALGVWLLWGGAAAWSLAVLTFLAFAGVSLHLGMIGQASCGCFGSVKASPWAAFGVDVAALALLAVGRPDWKKEKLGWRGLAVVAGGAVALLGVLWVVAVAAFGSVEKALAVLRHERVRVTPSVDFGSGKAGHEVEASVEVSNFTDGPVRLIGGTSDCSCVTTEDLPVTIPAGEKVRLAVFVRLPRGKGLMNRKAWLHTDHEQARTLLFALTGYVEE